MAGTVQTPYVSVSFLVLEGLSGLGQTYFSMSPLPCSLEVTCSNCQEPDLREVKLGTHELVLLDEATCILALQCNEHMQTGPA